MSAIRVALMLFVAGCGPAVSVAPGETSGETTSVVVGSETGSGGTGVTTTSMGSTTVVGSTTGGSSSGEVVTDSFVIGPDVLDPFACDILGQDCDASQKCVPVTDSEGYWNSTRCVPVFGEGIAGDPCTRVGDDAPGVDTCAFGHLCWDYDNDGKGNCLAMCTLERGSAVCAEGFECVFYSDEGVLWLCKPACDPLAQDCLPGETCTAETYEFVCVPDMSGDEGQANDVCEYWGDCDPGLVCAYSEGVSAACDPQDFTCCTPLCQLPDGPCPNPDQACVPWSGEGEAPPGDEDVGVCAIPA